MVTDQLVAYGFRSHRFSNLQFRAALVGGEISRPQRSIVKGAIMSPKILE